MKDGSAHTSSMSAHQQFETYLFLKIRVMNINNRQIPRRDSPKRSHPCSQALARHLYLSKILKKCQLFFTLLI